MIYSTESLGVLIFIAVYIYISSALQKEFRMKVKACKKDIFKHESKIKSLEYDTLSGDRVIRAYGMQKFFCLECHRRMLKYKREKVKKFLCSLELNIKLTVISIFVMLPSIYLFVSHKPPNHPRSTPLTATASPSLSF